MSGEVVLRNKSKKYMAEIREIKTDPGLDPGC